MRIVLAMLEPPLPFGNAAARWFYVLLKELVARGHRVTAFAACSKPEEMTKAHALFPAPQYDLRLFAFPHRSGLKAKLETFRRPFSYMFSDEFQQDFQSTVAAGCDVIHLEQLWCGWLVNTPALVQKTLLNVHFLSRIDLRDVRPPGRMDRLRQRLMLQAESRLLKRFRTLTAFSDRLTREIQAVNSAARTAVVPLGLDASLYDYMPDERRGTALTAGLIGSMGWHPSRSAAVRLLTRLWPAIRQRLPEAKLTIVGWDARRALAEHATDDSITILENVPDTRVYFEAMGVMVYAPARGSGMKVKVLEALAYGVPVVTTTEGVEGLPAVDGVHAGIADDDAGLIERAVALMTDPAAQNRQRAAGRQMLESHCGPTPTVDAVEAAYDSMLKGPGS
jgi:glycosyltransferase involved in cell wall biosynthesis